jgi:hypothetical protein
MKNYLLALKFFLWIPILFIGLLIFFILYPIRLLIWGLSKFITKQLFFAFMKDIQQASVGTIIENKLNDTIKKFYNDEEE